MVTNSALSLAVKIAGLFIPGGDFRDKLKALFTCNAKVTFPK